MSHRKTAFIANNQNQISEDIEMQEENPLISTSDIAVDIDIDTVDWLQEALISNLKSLSKMAEDRRESTTAALITHIEQRVNEVCDNLRTLPDSVDDQIPFLDSQDENKIESPIYKPLIPGFLFFKMDDVELIRKALEEYKPGFDDVNYRIIDLIERIDKRVEQLKKNQSGFEDA